MPEITIEQWYIDTYEQNVLHGLQQKESRLEPYVRSVELKGEKRRFNYLGSRTMKEIKGKWEDTEIEDSKHKVRWVFDKRFGDAFSMDENDIEYAFTDPTSDMTVAGINAALRLKDELIIKAFYGNAIEGHDADEIAAYPSTQRLNIQLGSPASGAANQGLNIEKLKMAAFYLDRAETNPDDTRIFTCTAYQIKNMLDQIEATSADYTPVKALYEGKVDHFMGFKFVKTQLLPWAANIRSCTAFTSSAMGLAIRKGITVKSASVPTKNFDLLTQLQMRGGAVRIYDKGVVDIPCAEPEEYLASSDEF
mgnify:CR=1 FL=1